MLKKSLLMFTLLSLLFSSNIILANEGYNDLPFIITADGHIGFDVEEEYLYAENNARFEYQDIVVKAEKIAVYASEERLIAEGDQISLYIDEQKIEGSYLDFNYNEGSGYLADASTDLDEVFYKGEKINLYSDRDNNYSVDKATITSCVLQDPHYSFQAGEVKIYPGEKIVARNIWLRLGGYRILYLPVYSARYNQDNNEYDSIVPIPEISYNTSEGIYMSINYPYQISDNFTGEIDAKINQKGNKSVEVNNRYRLIPELDITNSYIYNEEYDDDDKDEVEKTSELSTGIEYQKNHFKLASLYVYDFFSRQNMLDLNASYNARKVDIGLFNRFIDDKLKKQNYNINYKGKYPIELLYRKGYSLDYFPYLRVNNIKTGLLGFDINSTLGIGRVSHAEETVNKADINLNIRRSLIRNENYNLDFHFKKNSNLYLEDEQFSLHDYYNYFYTEIRGSYQHQIAKNVSLKYNLAYEYSWDEGNANLNDLKDTGENIKPGISLKYDKPEDYSAWLIEIDGNYTIDNQELDELSLRVKRELDCFSYYFDLDVLEKSIGVGMNF